MRRLQSSLVRIAMGALACGGCAVNPVPTPESSLDSPADDVLVGGVDAITKKDIGFPGTDDAAGATDQDIAAADSFGADASSDTPTDVPADVTADVPADVTADVADVADDVSPSGDAL